MQRKGQSLGLITAAAIEMVVLGILLIVGTYIVSSTQASFDNTSTAYLVGGNITSGNSTLGTWIPILAVAIGGGSALIVVLAIFRGRNMGGKA